jgi:hypothetical protein
MAQPQLDHIPQQARDRHRLDQLDLPADELVQCLAVDPVFHRSSFACC